MYAYHIDRKSQLKANQTLNLKPLNDFLPNEFLKLEFLKPLKEGLSHHGMLYLSENFLKSYCFNDIVTFNLELIFELIRQTYFPNKFSRLQSVFAVKDMSQIENWNCLFPDKSNYQIAKLEFDAKNYLEFDASFLQSAMGIKDSYYYYNALYNCEFALNYWQSSSNPNKTQPELIIRPPIKVIEIIPNL